MRFRLFLYAAVAASLVGGTALVADALTVSDEEAVERLADDLIDDPASTQLEWTDADRVPVAVQMDGRPGTLSAVFRAFDGDDVELVQRSVSIENDQATLAVRARVDGDLRDARFRLERDAERGWLITRVVAD